MPKFHVTNTFELREQQLFVLAGSVVEGEIRAGMFVNLPFNPAVAMTARIHSIEFARRQGGVEDVCLCLESKSDESELWRDLNIDDETLDVTEDGSA